MDVGKAQILAQLVETLNESVKFLEVAYNKRDLEGFNKAKKHMLIIHNEINKNLNS